MPEIDNETFNCLNRIKYWNPCAFNEKQYTVKREKKCFVLKSLELNIDTGFNFAAISDELECMSYFCSNSAAEELFGLQSSQSNTKYLYGEKTLASRELSNSSGTA